MPQDDDKKKNEISVRLASDFMMEYPDDGNLKDQEKTRIQNAINRGGIVIGQRTYMSEKSIPALLSTDTKGTQIVLNSAPKDEIKQYGAEDYLSCSQLKKEMTDRVEQPRSTLEREKVKYAESCMDTFSQHPILEMERSIEADRINKERKTIGKKQLRIETQKLVKCQEVL